MPSPHGGSVACRFPLSAQPETIALDDGNSRLMATRAPVLLMTGALGLGGTELELADNATYLHRNRFEPNFGCVISTGVRRAELDAAGVPILTLPMRSLASASAARNALQIGRYVRRHKIQIVHTFDYPMNVFGAPSAWVAR